MTEQLVYLLTAGMFATIGAGLHRLWRDDRDAFPWPTPRNDIEYRNIRVTTPPRQLVDWQQMEDYQ